MFIKIVKNQIVKTLETLNELRQEFPHISFPEEAYEKKYAEKIKLPQGWYVEGSKEAKKKLGE